MFLQIGEGCLSVFIQHTISILGPSHHVDCLPLTNEKLLICYAAKDNNRLVHWDTVTNTCSEEIKDSLTSLFGLCKYQEQALISDCKKHCIASSTLNPGCPSQIVLPFRHSRQR